MAYSKSLARVDFEQEALKLLRLAKEVSFKKSPLSYEHKQLVYQSCIFLLCARIEDYTKSVIEWILYNYRYKSARLSQIPENARVKALVEYQNTHFRNYFNQGDERKLIQNLSLSKGTYQIINDDDNFTNQIKVVHILGTNKYPSLKNLKLVFNRLGIEDIVKQINTFARKDLMTAFDSFLSLRESIAHQSTSNLTINDIKRHFDNVCIYINHIDRILYKHICKTSTSKFWTS